MIEDSPADIVKAEPVDDGVYLSDSNSGMEHKEQQMLMEGFGGHEGSVDTQQHFMDELLGNNSTGSDARQMVGDSCCYNMLEVV